MMVRLKHRFASEIFHENEIRGIYGDTLTLADAEVLGRAFGKFVRDNGGRRIVLAFDGRKSSPDLAAAVSSGLKAAGLTVVHVGRGPTPMLCFALQRLDADAGIMVTGSHLPAQWNGFKLYLDSRSCTADDLEEIAQVAADGDFVYGRGSQEDHPLFRDYLAYLLDQAGGATAGKVIWDAGNGATGEMITALSRYLAGEHLLTNEIVDGSFPCHLPDPSDPETIAHLNDLVVNNACDIGIALDGDGDQFSVVDQYGDLVRSDIVMSLLVREVLRDHAGGRIVVDIRVGQFLLDQILCDGGMPIFCEPSCNAMKTKMTETQAAFAGHMDGHFIFAEKYGLADDALAAALRLLKDLETRNLAIHQLKKNLPLKFYVPRVQIPCPPGREMSLIGKVGWEIVESDTGVVAGRGIRVTTDDGWWALWPAQDSSGLIATLEGRDEATFKRLMEDFAGALSRNYLPVPNSLFVTAAQG